MNDSIEQKIIPKAERLLNIGSVILLGLGSGLMLGGSCGYTAGKNMGYLYGFEDRKPAKVYFIQGKYREYDSIKEKSEVRDAIEIEDKKGKITVYLQRDDGSFKSAEEMRKEKIETPEEK